MTDRNERLHEIAMMMVRMNPDAGRVGSPRAIAEAVLPLIEQAEKERDEALTLLRRWDRRWTAVAILIDRHDLWSALWGATDDDSASSDTEDFLARFPEQEDTTDAR